MTSWKDMTQKQRHEYIAWFGWSETISGKGTPIDSFKVRTVREFYIRSGTHYCPNHDKLESGHMWGRNVSVMTPVYIEAAATPGK